MPEHDAAADGIDPREASRAVDARSLSHWYPLAPVEHVTRAVQRTRLFGRPIDFARIDGAEGPAWRIETLGEALPAAARYGLLWTTLAPEAERRPIVHIAQADEADRRHVGCGTIAVAASGLRLVENFLDMAHFPFVHDGILGAEPQTEVPRYEVELRETEAEGGGTEIWATNCRFHQPQAALSAPGGMMAEYVYRVAAPFTTLLHKTAPGHPGRWDVIVLFIQPTTSDTARAHPVMFLLDDDAGIDALVEFQQTIFLQDRIILENQRPSLLPLDAQSEIPTLADRGSVAYRRWLRAGGVSYGTVT